MKPPSGDVTVVVPLAGACPHRKAAWDFIRARWEREHPTWPIALGECPTPWRKAVAVRDGVRKARTPIVIVTDADVWTPGITDAVEIIRSGRTAVAQPHARFARLTPDATQRVLDGTLDLDTAPQHPANLLERPYRQVLAGGVLVLTTEAALTTPGDPRFVGWGGQDISWGIALTTVFGRAHRGRGTTVHLWHPPQERVARNTGSPQNMRLLARYRSAARSPARMLALVREGQEAVP